MLSRIDRSEAALCLALSGLVLWAPLPWGSVTPAAGLLFRLTAFGLVVWAVAGRPAVGLRGGRAAPATLALAAPVALGLLGLAQSIPWPAAITGLLSPEHARLYREAAACLPAAAAPGWIPPTLDAELSRSAGVSWLAAAALLFVALIAGRRARGRRWLLAALVAAALLQLLIGLVDLWRSSPAGLALLLRPSGRIRGSFANPNHLSLLLELALATVAAWVWHAAGRRGAATGRRLAGVALPLVVWSALLGGVVLSGSRAGLAAALAGLAVQAAGMALAGGGRRRWAPLAALVLVLATVAALSSRVEIRRYESASMFEDNLSSRLLVVPAALRLWRSFPVTGTGLGTFEEAFPSTAPAELSTGLWNRAHNNPLELLVTGGVVGLALGAVLAGALLAAALRVTRRGRGREERAAGLAALGALGAAAVHELLDFGLVIPANHLALLVIVGAAVAAGSAGPRSEAQAGGP